MHTARKWKEQGASMLFGRATLRISTFTNFAVLQTSSCRILMETSLHRHDRLNHWPLVTDSASNPSHLSGYQVDGTESSNHVIMWLVLLATNLHLRCLPKVISLTETQMWSRGAFQEYQDNFIVLITWEIPRVLMELFVRNWDKYQIYSSHKSQYHIVIVFYLGKFFSF